MSLVAERGGNSKEANSMPFYHVLMIEKIFGKVPELPLGSERFFLLLFS